MPAVIVQYVSKPRPGSSLPTILEHTKEAASLFRKHGADVSVWTELVGEIGNIVFAARYDSFEAYGHAANLLASDPAVLEWRAKALKAGP